MSQEWFNLVTSFISPLPQLGTCSSQLGVTRTYVFRLEFLGIVLRPLGRDATYLQLVFQELKIGSYRACSQVLRRELYLAFSGRHSEAGLATSEEAGDWSQRPLMEHH